MTQKPFDYRVT